MTDNNFTPPEEESPQAFSNEQVRIEHEYQLSPLVQIPMVGVRLVMCSLFIVLIAFFGFGIPEQVIDRYLYQPSLLWGLVGIFIFWPVLAYRYWSFQLRKYDIIVASGVLFRREISIPWSRVQQVDSRANPLDRLCGLKRLVLHSAGSRAGRTSIPGIQVKLAEALQTHLATIVEKFHGSKSDRLEKFRELMKKRKHASQGNDGAGEGE